MLNQKQIVEAFGVEYSLFAEYIGDKYKTELEGDKAEFDDFVEIVECWAFRTITTPQLQTLKGNLQKLNELISFDKKCKLLHSKLNADLEAIDNMLFYRKNRPFNT